MYIKDKDEMEATLNLLQDYINDAWAWDANHDDILNEELGKMQNAIEEAHLKLKTL